MIDTRETIRYLRIQPLRGQAGLIGIVLACASQTRPLGGNQYKGARAVPIADSFAAPS